MQHVVSKHGDSIAKQLGATDIVNGHQHAIVVDERGRYATSEQTSKSAAASHSHGVVVDEAGNVTLLASDGHTHEAVTVDGARSLAKAVHKPSASPIAKSIHTRPSLGLDETIAKYAREHGVDRPAATAAVLKTAEGRRLYAESIGRAPAESAAPDPVTKSAGEYKAELDALTAKHMTEKGIDRPTARVEVLKTAEGRHLYNMARRAELGAS